MIFKEFYQNKIFSGPKFETNIQLANLIHVLGVHAMPVLKLRKYILAIDDIDERKKQAYRWKDHQTALDVSFQSDLTYY